MNHDINFQDIDPEQIKEDLFNYAIDREDVKLLLAMIPENSTVKPFTVEYELQMLKIISVGWSLSYYLENLPVKDRISELFWQAVHEFSRQLSETTGLMIGNDINYFQTLKERLDLYVDALNQSSEKSEPVVVIGPKFAEICGNVDDVFIVMTGAKMFNNAIVRVKQYLEVIHLI
jgi:hypothetical protein